jgi:predicted Zn-dependent protease
VEEATHVIVDYLLEQGKVATAQRFAEANIRFNNKCPLGHLQLGIALEEQGEFAAAAQSLLRAIQQVESLHGTDKVALAHLCLAECAARTNRLDLLDPFLRRWRAALPKDPASLFCVALCFIEAGALDEAEAILARQRTEAPDAMSPGAYDHELGLCALRRGDVDSARERLRASVDAGDALAHRSMAMLAIVEIMAGDAERAVRWARNAVALAPRDIAHRVNLAAALAENSDYEDAVEVYRDVLRDAPGFGEVQQSMALAMLESGDNDGGLAILLDLERRGFDLRRVSANIGVALARRGRPADLTEALARHERAFNMDFAQGGPHVQVATG